MTEHEVNEDSTSYLTVTLLGKDDAPAQPISATYDLVDMDSETKIKDGESLTFVDGVVEITLDKEDAQIFSQANKREHRKITIHAIYGAADELRDDYLIGVLNLDWVS